MAPLHTSAKQGSFTNVVVQLSASFAAGWPCVLAIGSMYPAARVRVGHEVNLLVLAFEPLLS